MTRGTLPGTGSVCSDLRHPAYCPCPFAYSGSPSNCTLRAANVMTCVERETKQILVSGNIP